MAAARVGPDLKTQPARSCRSPNVKFFGDAEIAAAFVELTKSRPSGYKSGG